MIVVWALLILFFLLLLLYARWRIAYGYPPKDIPPVICYHKLSDRLCLEGTWTTPRRFLDHVDRLRDRGYRFIGEDGFYDRLARPSPDHSRDVLLTFDDGYAEIHDVFTEHLAPRGVPILVFLVTDYVGEENVWDLSWGRRPFRHLTWEEVSRMIQHGAAFGIHGATHADLTRVPPRMLDREVAGSKRLFHERTGRTPRSFSYPFGRYNEEVRGAVERAGYDGAFSLYPRLPNDRVDRFALRRNGVYVIDTNLSIRWKLERTPLSWFEEMKCRAINSVAILTPVLKRVSSDPDR